MKQKNVAVAGFLAASAIFFGGAYAAGPGCDHEPGVKGAMHRGGMMDPGARVERRLSRLKGELKPNSQQEPLWQAFAEQSKAAADKAAQTMREHMKDDKPISAPERMARMQGAMKERLAAMESVSESFNRLYAALTPEQKTVADKHFSTAGRHAHGPARSGPRPRPGGPAAPGAAAPRQG